MSAGQDHTQRCFSGAITCETPLLWGLQKDFLVLLAFPILCGPVPSGERGAPLSSFAMSHPVRHGNISIGQLPDRPAAVPLDILQTPAVNSAAPWLWALPHMPACSAVGRAAQPCSGHHDPHQGFVLGSCSELTPWRWRNEARMEVTGQKRLDLSPHCCGSVCPPLRFYPQTSAWTGACLG